MKYSKPEISLLGDAGRVIQNVGKGQPQDTDPSTGKPLDFVPAYDLDE